MLTDGSDRIDNGIDYSSGGFGGFPQGRWKKPNGKQVFLGQYWQSTVQFVGPGVTFNIYFAHCTTYILAKGASSYVIVDSVPRLAGGGEQCCGHAENVDVGKSDNTLTIVLTWRRLLILVLSLSLRTHPVSVRSRAGAVVAAVDIARDQQLAVDLTSELLR